MSVALLVATARAQDPPGLLPADTTLIVCPDPDSCADEMYWITSMGWTGSESGEGLATTYHTIDEVVDLHEDGWRDGVAPDNAYAEALGRAREAYAAGYWAIVDAATTDGLRVLDRWDGTVASQDLFELRLLRGAALYARGDGLGHDIVFRQAAAVAWNRSVRMPAVHPEALDAYYEVVDRLIAEGTATIELGPTGDDIAYFLDGVLLGSGPLVLHVLPGQHRVTAQRRHSDDHWKADLQVEAGRTARAQAWFGGFDDPDAANLLLARALEDGRLEPALAEVLARWCRQEGMHRVRVVAARAVELQVEPDEPTMPTYRLQQAVFDAHLRSLERGPDLPP